MIKRRESEIENYSNDFLAPKLHSFLKENCYLSYFDSNMDIKRQLEEIAERQDGTVICEYKELFTTIMDQYEEGTPSYCVAERCLTAVTEFEVQYVRPEDISRKHRREGRGIIGEDSSIKKNKLSSLVTRYAKRIIEEEQIDAMEQCEKEKQILLQRKEELEKSIKKLQEELKEDIEKIQPDPIPLKDTITLSTHKQKQNKKKNKKDDHQLNQSQQLHASQTHSTLNSSLTSHALHPNPISTPQPIIPTTVNKEPQISLAPEEIKERNEGEIKLLLDKLLTMKSDDLSSVAKILSSGNDDDCVRFDFTKISEGKYRIIKDMILKK